MSWAELSWSEILLGRVVLSELSLGRVVLHPTRLGVKALERVVKGPFRPRLETQDAAQLYPMELLSYLVTNQLHHKTSRFTWPSSI